MSFSINTNVASLQAQNYLRINSNFQSKTIEQVTSGLKIVNSGDDAAGLAIANSYRSTEAVLTQGVQNANDGLSQLQIMDGGISNISQLLDRARTLATQSASGTFAGGATGRGELNSEFQSVLGEIDRQAQAIGLNQGGQYAKVLGVFIGGGQGTTSAAVITNGTVSVDLSKSTVDTQSLGLKGFTAGYQVTAGSPDTGMYDLSAASTSSVTALIGAATTASFTISGPGFAAGAGSAITVTVNLAGVADPASLATAINAGIASATLQGSAQAQAFQGANIQAVIHTGTDGAQQLLFTGSSAFQVVANDVVANGFMGNTTGNTGGHASGATGTGATPSTSNATEAAASFVAGGTQQTSSLTFTTMSSSSVLASSDTQVLTFTALDATGVQHATTVTLQAGTSASMTGALAVAAINTALQKTGVTSLQNIVATADGEASGATKIIFTAAGTPFTVTVGADIGVGVPDANGLQVPAGSVTASSLTGVGETADISTQTGAEAAVTALANSVSDLGNAQATVGKGENQFNYAINLAQSQLSNLASAESGIRDANLATAAANLTKAQILMQAGVAALAQANSAPQNILSLLKG